MPSERARFPDAQAVRGGKIRRQSGKTRTVPQDSAERGCCEAAKKGAIGQGYVAKQGPICDADHLEPVHQCSRGAALHRQARGLIHFGGFGLQQPGLKDIAGHWLG